MSNTPSNKSIHVVIDDELYQRLNRVFEWGERNSVLKKVISWVCDIVEKKGKAALIVFLREEDFTCLLSEEEKEKEKEKEQDNEEDNEDKVE